MPAVRFDLYTWRARIAPAFLVLLPLAVAVFLWVPDFMLAGRLAGAVLSPLGVAMLLAQVGRDRGYTKQPQLWHHWGGAPTTQLLRHRTPESNPVLRERYHQKLRELQPDLVIPTLEEEEQDPQKADHIYEACVRHLITQTRNREQFPLLFYENVNYGFRRNLWGMRLFGTLFTLASLAASGLYLWLHWERAQRIDAEAIVSGTFSLGLLLFWLFWVTPGWVRIDGDAYAARLFETCEQLEGKK